MCQEKEDGKKEIHKTETQIRWENKAYLDGVLVKEDGTDLTTEEIEWLYRQRKHR